MGCFISNALYKGEESGCVMLARVLTSLFRLPTCIMMEKEFISCQPDHREKDFILCRPDRGNTITLQPRDYTLS
jgi:hypothetical protein